MSIATFITSRRENLGAAKYKVKTSRNVKTPMSDGIDLLADIYFPVGEGDFPTILIRTPYLRKGFATFAQIYAERGFITVLQACRGTDGSGGKLEPLTCEREDGLATLKWLNEQDWFDGRLGSTGPSYLGYVQWAICDSMPENSAISTHIATSEYRSVLMPKGAINLQLFLSWMQLIKGLEGSPLKFTFRILTGNVEKCTQEAAKTLPLIDADIKTTGEKIPFWQDWMGKANDDESLWDSLDQSKRLTKNTPANFFVSGWYDFMIDQLIRDYKTLKAAGNNPYLTIGPWFHIHPKLIAEGVRSTLAWMHAHLNGDKSDLRDKPVRLHISGLNQWFEFNDFPLPRKHKSTTLFLAANSSLQQNKTASATPPATYRYDPNDPTPNIGGAIFAFTGAGPRDNKKLEQRKDVLIFTGQKLENPLTIIGQVKLTLFARSSLENTDFFARLCDVSPSDKSINICDGFERLTPTNIKKNKDNIWQFDIIMHHSAHQFKQGHQLRLQISSGATPRFSRNPGTGDSLLTTSKLVTADQEIFFDNNHPSAISLPVYEL